ncbi:hypothetical protein Btru_068134 [Bulinus truncatus]|nr:hypothetical protein Btru_068134 [Bulinus truncatus]
MAEDVNRQRQCDEVQALSSIYGDDWHVLDAENCRFSVHVAADSRPLWEINLQVRMPLDYPLQSPPEYQIDAVWLRGEERIRLEDKLSQVYCDNIGEDIVYLWVEAVREFLQQKSDKASPLTDDHFISEELTPIESNSSLFEDDQLYCFPSAHPQTSASSCLSDSCPDIIHGGSITDRKSTFQPHLAIVTDKSQVPDVMGKLLENKKIANATHNIFAYRIVTDTGITYQGCHDDGETHAGSRMLHLLQIMKVENVLVVVSRWYGGIQLGPDRFKHINNCCRQILEANGFLTEKDGKKLSKKEKKSR